MKIEVHPLTNNPTAAWKDLSQTQKVIKIHVSCPKDKVSVSKVRINYYFDIYCALGLYPNCFVIFS